MDPIKKAIVEAKFRIPKEILDVVFIDSSRVGRTNWGGNVDEQILRQVVKPRVLVDCNLVGGVEHLIPLDGLRFDVPDDYPWATVVHVPKSRTFGKSINAVMHLQFFNPSSVAGYLGGSLMGTGMGDNTFSSRGSDNSAVMAATAGIMSAMDKIPYTSTANIALVAENTVLIRDGMAYQQSCWLKCHLENDEHLSNLALKSYMHFSDLVELALKSYIYNQLIIKIDIGQLYYGQNVGAFKEIVSSYADAEVNYRDFLRNKWQKVAFLNDDQRARRLYQLMLGANH